MSFLTKYGSNLIAHGFCSPSHYTWRDRKWFKEWISRFSKILWWQFFFLYLWQDQPLWGELKTNGEVTFITILLHSTLSLFYFVRNSQHPRKWSVSLKSFFRKCKCICCYLRISSNFTISVLGKSFQRLFVSVFI